jgi:hypothetical protein
MPDEGTERYPQVVLSKDLTITTQAVWPRVRSPRNQKLIQVASTPNTTTYARCRARP